MSVYLDHAASSPLRPEALEAYAAYARSNYAGANPNSLHTPGRQAAGALEGARKDIARLIGPSARPSEVLFTSGGTEGDNLAVFGLADGAHQRDHAKTTVIISAIEHEAVLSCAPELRKHGFNVRILQPSRDGIIEPRSLSEAIDDTCALVSVMTANNETGIIQPVEELAGIAHAHGALFHSDAVQAFARVPLAATCADALTVTAHKVGGPVGIGALYVRTGVQLMPSLHGGGQERGLRPGTQNVGGALAFAAAAKACAAAHMLHGDEIRSRAERLVERLVSACPSIHPTSAIPYGEGRLPGTVSLYVHGIEAGSVLLKLDAEGFAISSGSACAAASLDPSHVLSAMGLPREDSLGALRISFDERVSDDELDAFASALISCIANLRR